MTTYSGIHSPLRVEQLRLGELEPGDVVSIETASGSSYTFTVTAAIAAESQHVYGELVSQRCAEPRPAATPGSFLGDTFVAGVLRTEARALFCLATDSAPGKPAVENLWTTPMVRLEIRRSATNAA